MICPQCQAIHNKVKFCSRSCSAKFNNKLRAPRSEESKAKTSISVKRRRLLAASDISDNSKLNFSAFFGKNHPGFKHGRYQKMQRNCVICQVSMISSRKTCSPECFRTFCREKRIKYLKENAGTFNWIKKGKMNYFESQFDQWLKESGYSNGDDYVALSHVLHNDEGSTYYILDFWFPNLNLNIELDGSHHEKPEQQIRDRIRDEWMKRVHNINVIRISGRSWNKPFARTIIKNQLLDGALKRS